MVFGSVLSLFPLFFHLPGRIATSGTDFGSDERVFLGWLLVVTGSLVIVWPFAHYFRQLPFANRVL